MLPSPLSHRSAIWDDHPFIVIWEVTRACALACRHCRAEAQARRHPDELEGKEAFAFLDQVARAQPAVFILTGGDPSARPDLLELVRYASDKGLRVAMSPSATPRFLRADLPAFKEAGLRRISLSLDGATPSAHDRFRGVKGTWDWTMKAFEAAQRAGIEVQINTTFTRQNFDDLEDFTALIRQLRPTLWSVFQLVPTGRAQRSDLLTPAEMEELFERLYQFSGEGICPVKTTEGMHYRRVAWQQWKKSGCVGPKPEMLGINDGKGFVFVSHTGDVCPSGFLPLRAGNVRERELLDVYRNAPLFRRLRDPDLLRGKCRRCEFRSLCGGSRARSFAMTGDYLAEEPLCVYEPPGAEEADPEPDATLTMAS